MVPHLVTATLFCRRLTIARIFPSTTLIWGNRPAQHRLQYSHRTMSSRSLQTDDKPLTPGTTLCGQSGRMYTIQEVLAERRKPLLCVYRARYELNPMISSIDGALIIRSAEGQNFIIKNMIPGETSINKFCRSPWPRVLTCIPWWTASKAPSCSSTHF